MDWDKMDREFRDMEKLDVIMTEFRELSEKSKKLKEETVAIRQALEAPVVSFKSHMEVGARLQDSESALNGYALTLRRLMRDYMELKQRHPSWPDLPDDYIKGL